MNQQTLNNEWNVVNEQIDISRIKRYSWKKMLGESLTSRIHRLRNKGHTSKEVIYIIQNTIQIKDFVENNPQERFKVMENITISVCARFGENNTAQRIKEQYQ